ncbi:MAG: hypothetical protein RIB61_15760 [Roseicyclus sp.]
MTRPLMLEDFSSAVALGRGEPSRPTDSGPPAATAETEDEKLAAFDRGYKDGWDDCAREEAEANRRIGAALEASLRDMTLLYAEARQEVLASLAPLFEDIAAQLLPRLAAEAVAPAVIAELEAIAADGLHPRPVLIAAPAALPGLERLIDMREGLEIDLKTEPAFADDQVSIRFGAERRDIDLSDAADRMAEAIRAFVRTETGGTLQTFEKGVA